MSHNFILIPKVRNEEGFVIEFTVQLKSSVILGTFTQDVDGFYYYWPSKLGGCFSDYDLTSLGEKLQELNKPWSDKIEEDFNSFNSVPNTDIPYDPDDDDFPF